MVAQYYPSRPYASWFAVLYYVSLVTSGVLVLFSILDTVSIHIPLTVFIAFIVVLGASVVAIAFILLRDRCNNSLPTIV